MKYLEIEENPFVDASLNLIPGLAGQVREMESSMKSVINSNSAPLILIVEDERLNIMMLQNLIESAGFDTVTARDLYYADEILKKYAVSLILLDVNLPDGNGIDWCAKIKKEQIYASVPVIFVTASDLPKEKVRGFDAGGVDYITKPYNPPEVLARVRTHLRLKLAYEKMQEQQLERLNKMHRSQRLLMPDEKFFSDARFAIATDPVVGFEGVLFDVKKSGSEVWDYLLAETDNLDIDSAVWKASLKTLFQEYSAVMHTPEQVIRLIHGSIRTVLSGHPKLTLVFVRLNRKYNVLSILNAGFPQALIQRKTGEIVDNFHSDVPSRFSPDPVLEIKNHKIGHNDRIFFCSGRIAKENVLSREPEWVRSSLSEVRPLPLHHAVKELRVRFTAHAGHSSTEGILLGIEV
ncbi:MAG: response regulator [Balneolaceae bacterium]|nr:MAG: response regulator [Balneolaceae bacterium]